MLLRDGAPFLRSNFNSDFEIVQHVARLDKGIPNPKVRPMLAGPWETSFDFDFVPTPDCTWEVLVKVIQQAGSIGLGTYRPIFGTYRVELSDIRESN